MLIAHDSPAVISTKYSSRITIFSYPTCIRRRP